MAERVKGAVGLRLCFIKGLLWRPSKWFVVVGVFGLLGIYDLVVDQFVDPDTQGSFPTALEITRWLPWWAWGIGLIAALFLVTIEGAYRKTNALEKQRNDAVAALKAIPGATPNSPKVADVRVHISYSQHMFGISGAQGFDHPKLKPGILMIRVIGDVIVEGSTTLESIALRVAGDPLPAITWRSEFVHAGVTWGLAEYFEIPMTIGAGEHFARLLAFAEGAWWASKDQFSIVIPVQQGSHT